MLTPDLLKTMRTADRELAVVLFFDQEGQGIGADINQGNSNSVNTTTLDLICKAEEIGASKVLFAHNHPSGRPQPSFEDELTFMERRDAFEGRDIEVIDNLIITAEQTFSFRENGHF